MDLVSASKVVLAADQKLSALWKQKQDDWVSKCLLEASQVAVASVTAWLSLALDRQPTDPEVQEFLSQGLEDPAFPARMRRLFAELLETPSREKRGRLAAALTIGAHASPPEIRDRIDVLVTQLFDEDVALLKLMVAAYDDSPVASTGNVPCRLCVSLAGERFQCDAGVRMLGPTFRWEWPLPFSPFGGSVVAFDNLVATGCVVRTGSPPSPEGNLVGVEPTALGRALLRVLSSL